MTEPATVCDRCGRPVADGAHCCNACVEQTRENLVFIAETGSELETTLTRQDRVSTGNGGRASAETPLPVNLYASDVSHRLRNVLTTWARVLVEESGADWPPRQEPVSGPVCRQAARTWCTHGSCRAIMISRHPTEVGIAETARFLHKRAGWIAHREWGPEAFDDLSRVAVDLERAVNSPPPMISLGKCETDGCDGQIRARQEAAFAKCPKCREAYDVNKRKDQLIRRAGHMNLTAANIARALTAAMPKELPVKHVYNWAQRGKLRRRGTDPNGRPTYRLSDARALHLQAILKDIKANQAESEAAA